MKQLRMIACLLLAVLTTSTFALPEEPDLSNIKTVNDAKSYYESCRLSVFKQNVSRDDIVTTIWNLYYLGRKLGMTDMTVDQKFASYSCGVEVKSSSEADEVSSLMFRIAFTYKGLQRLLGPSMESLERIYWMNFESIYPFKTIRWDANGQIVFTEYELNGIKFIVFHNVDKNFAYDVKVYHKEKEYSKKLKKSIYKTLEKEITIMPEAVFFVSSSIDGMDVYFTPSSFEVKNKYYVGNK